ncbi:MAG: mitochondrial ribosomal small subunit component [Phylliscum demangeonii]|nr:MAG: mitochondrial ribosomal small subunit component [Phylliscum demangeonii]
MRPRPGEKLVPIRTNARAATILPNFVGLKFQIHNGMTYTDLFVTEDMVGYKLGEFAHTRKNFKYNISKNK